jgi:hypothetical protein
MSCFVSTDGVQQVEVLILIKEEEGISWRRGGGRGEDDMEEEGHLLPFLLL